MSAITSKLPSERDVLAYCRALNAAQSKPCPECRECKLPFHPDEGGAVNSRYCLTCEINFLAYLASRIASARGKRAFLQAAREIVRYAKGKDPW